MDRSTIYTEEQGRSFDILWLQKDAMSAIGGLQVGVMGTNTTVVDGLAATPTGPASLVVNLAAGHIYEQAEADATAWGSLSSDATVIQQQGYAAAQTVTLATTGLSSGQNRWALIQAQFEQVDAVRSGDPTGGLLYYWNSANPDDPLEGPGGGATIQNTVRQGVCSITVIYGAAATTGAEVPPNPSVGNVPLYLIDLTYGQTQITSGEIIVAGPSVGPNVPSNYPGAPFVAGLLNSHHNGKAGQAPKIKLTSAEEVQGILPMANLPASSALSGSGLSACYTYAGNPNGHVAGVTGVAGVSPPDICYDTVNAIIWICTTTGNAASAVWKSVNGAAKLFSTFSVINNASQPLANGVSTAVSPGTGTYTGVGSLSGGTFTFTREGVYTISFGITSSITLSGASQIAGRMYTYHNSSDTFGPNPGDANYASAGGTYFFNFNNTIASYFAAGDSASVQASVTSTLNFTSGAVTSCALTIGVVE